MLLQMTRQRFPADHEYTRDDQFPMWTLEVTLTGVMRRRLGPASRLRPQPNQALILVPPRSPYALRGEAAGEEVWALFEPRPELLPLLDWPIGEFGVPQLSLAGHPAAREVLGALAEACDWFERRGPAALLLAENAFERGLLLAAELAADAAGPAMDERVETALAYLEATCTQQPTVEALAARVNLSPSRFAHLFRAQTGRSPGDYAEELRLAIAQRLLLRSDQPVKAVAAEAGYDDPAYFSARFRHRFGQSPQQWRTAPGRTVGQ